MPGAVEELYELLGSVARSLRTDILSIEARRPTGFIGVASLEDQIRVQRARIYRMRSGMRCRESQAWKELAALNGQGGTGRAFNMGPTENGANAEVWEGHRGACGLNFLQCDD
jgi:hypothetical protein